MANDELKMLFATNLKRWLKIRDKTQADICRYMKVSSATVSDWCHGNKMPRTDKIQALCSWLGIELSDLLEEQKEDDKEVYYLNDDARDLAQFLFENPDYRVLFDASRKVKREDLEIVKQLIDRFS